jgi:autotransporter-associated beta strand protein
MKQKTTSLAALAGFIIAGPAFAAELFTDNFDVTSNNSPNAEIGNPGRQGGALATLSYLLGGDVQVGNTTVYAANTPSDAGDDMLTVGTIAYVNYDFSNQTLPLEITFRGLVDNGNPDPNNWVSFSVGDNTIQYVNGATVSSILFRANGATQLFDNGSPSVGASGFAPGSEVWTDYKIVLSDTAGTGSAWGTGGSRADYYANGSFMGTMAISQLTAGEGYIGFASAYIAGYDDLKIKTVEPVTNSWNTGDGAWDTITTNWSGPTTWTNGNDAVFSNTDTASIITLSSGITAYSVNVGNGGNNANYTFTGGSLSAVTFRVQGTGSNDLGTAGYPLTTLDNATVTVNGDMGVGRAHLAISGNSTVIANRIGGAGIGGITAADWGQVTIQDNANVTATNGIVGGTQAWGLNLNGGTLTTKGIDFGPQNYFGTVNLNFNGTLVKANQDNANFITVTGGLDFNPEIKAGGAKIDTNGYAIGIGVPLQGSGALTKSGSGTLALTNTNTYTGETQVNAGTLSLGDGTTNTSLADTAAVVIGTDPTATLNLNYTGTDTVDSLTINGVAKPAGVYSSSDPSGRISGTGTLTVLTGAASPYTTWADSFLPGNDVSNPAGDNDNDGLTNQQEFAFGLSPISGSSVNPIVVQLNKTTGQFSYQRRAASGLTYKILTSTTLATGSWTEDLTAGQVAGAIDGNGNQTVVVTLTGAPLAASKLFVRVAAN